MIDAIYSLPDGPVKDKLKQQAKLTREQHEKGKELVTNLQDSLDTLRVSVRYLVFDLEATRRENVYLRNMLKEDNSDGSGT